MTELSGNLVLPNTVVSGKINFETTIQNIAPTKHEMNRYILPGFIDGHIHGGDGADTMDGVEAIHTLSRFHARHGTTTLLPTTITSLGRMLSTHCRLFLKLPGNKFPMAP